MDMTIAKAGTLLTAMILGGTTVSHGAVLLSVSETQIVRGAESTITIVATATAGEQVRGLELSPKVNDGGTANGGTATAPSIVAVPAIAGTIWPAGSTVDQAVSISSFPLFPQFSFSTPTLTAVSPSGIVAVLTLDTSALAANSVFTIDLTDSEFPSYFNTASGQLPVTDSAPFSILVVVPEPASAALLAGSGLLLLRRRRQRA